MWFIFLPLSFWACIAFPSCYSHIQAAGCAMMRSSGEPVQRTPTRRIRWYVRSIIGSSTVLYYTGAVPRHLAMTHILYRRVLFLGVCKHVWRVDLVWLFQVASMSRGQCWWTWSRAPWTLSDRVRSDRSSVLIISYSVSIAYTKWTWKIPCCLKGNRRIRAGKFLLHSVESSSMSPFRYLKYRQLILT